MGGLLYKDFVSINQINKVKLTWLLTGLTILFIGLRIAFPGTADIEAFLAENVDGEIVNVIDSFFFMTLGLFIVGTLLLMNGWTAKLVEMDEKNKIRDYISALPLEKNAYIASKYIFMAVSTYIFMSIYYIWSISCLAFCREGIMTDIVGIMGSMIPVFASFILLLAAIELPLFILLGKEKAMLIKVVFFMLIAFAIIGFVLFGDLVWFEEHIDIMAFAKWYKAHLIEGTLAVMMSPALVLAFYYGSYRVTCHFANKEDTL